MFIKIIKYLIFGLVQGLTEPLPISSSGHLVLAKYLLNTDAFDDLTFEIFLNFASFLAIFFIFRKEIISIIKSFLTYVFKKDKRDNKTKSEFKYALLVVVGSIPAAIGGFLLKDYLETKLGENIKLLGVAFLITAILLFIVRKMKGKKKDDDITYFDAIIVGLFEMAALIPGISRSGACLVGCLLMGLERDCALKYTFMLYLPVSLGSMALSIKDLMTIDNNLIIPYAIGFIASAVMTYFASLWYFDIVKRGRLAKFSIYLFLLGLAIIIFI